MTRSTKLILKFLALLLIATAGTAVNTEAMVGGCSACQVDCSPMGAQIACDADCGGLTAMYCEADLYGFCDLPHDSVVHCMEVE